MYVNHGFHNVVVKKPIRTISLQTFDRVFSTFSEMIDNEDFSINFLPDDNNEANLITYDSIKNICTAVEFEFQKSQRAIGRSPWKSAGYSFPCVIPTE